MAQFERFMHDENASYPALVKTALTHVQFETIHPLIDGNGRIGRLLIALLLHHSGILSQPLLYLSLYFKQNRADYYFLLDLVRSDGDWEAWIDFFLEGVEQTATGAVQTAQRLVRLFEADRQRLQELGRITPTVLLIFGAFRARPIMTLKDACNRTGLSFPAASKGMDALVNFRIAKEITGRQRNRVFAYDRYLTILNEGTEPL